MNVREDELSDESAPLFEDRADAGAQLARDLAHYRGQHALVLGLPRGGVPVAAPIAAALDAELDVIVARKLGAPGQEELGIGALTADGTRFINQRLVRAVGATPAYLERVTREQQVEAQRREQRFRQGLLPLALAGRIVIIVDDGLATGATMRAAVAAAQRAKPQRLIVAVPVGAADTCKLLEEEAHEVVCTHQPERFSSVGTYYRDFDQTRDEEVLELLRAHRAQLN
jgi:predicted phosphoribosyltransferase